MLETLRSFVNTWECDENDHLNVQFYFQRFADADAHFQLQSGLSRTLTGRRIDRHVRYHAECRVGALQAVRSGLAETSHDHLSVVHVLYETDSNRISATALDHYRPAAPIPEPVLARMPAADPADLAAARPRSFAEPPPETTITPERILAAGGFTTLRGVVKPAHCTAEGTVSDRHVIAAMSDAASHVWESAPMKRRWLEDNGCGRVAVEMRLVYGAPAPAGTLSQVISKWLGARSTVLRFRHHLFDAATGRCHAIVESAGLIMNLERRRAVRLPEGFRTEIEALAAHGPR